MATSAPPNSNINSPAWTTIRPEPNTPPVSVSVGGVSATISNGAFNLQYPSDLSSSDEYGKNMVVFFIQVASGSNIGSGEAANGGGDARSKSSTEIPVSGQRSGSEKIASVIGGISQSLGISSSVISGNTYKSLDAAICLYVPAGISNTYSVNWQTTDLGADAVGVGIDALGNALQSGGMLEAGGSLFSSALSRGGVSMLGTDYAQYTAGKVPGNSKEQQLFKSVGFRKFNFNYTFSPRSPGEANSVLDIIRMFRYHMLPEYADKSKFIFVYPSRFQVVYMIDGHENTYIEKQMTAVLTDMSVTYSDGAQFTTFQDGMPTQIKMSLNFTEIALPTKETSPFSAHGV